MKTAIVADTNSNLTPQMAEELDVQLIPMPFFIGGETYLEGSTCTHSMFFENSGRGRRCSPPSRRRSRSPTCGTCF